MTVDTMETTSRQRIFKAIQKYQSVTVSELSHLLDMTPANIRHHLAVLQTDGLIERIDARKKLGRGRPEVVYSVHNIFSEDGLENLTVKILKLWFSKLSSDQVDRNLKAIANQLAADSSLMRDIPINKKLTLCMSYLNGLHYQAQWEASPSGPRIKFGNCPYRRIVRQYPELCLMDKYLLEELAGYKITQKNKLDRDERGKLYCSFIGS